MTYLYAVMYALPALTLAGSLPLFLRRHRAPVVTVPQVLLVATLVAAWPVTVPLGAMVVLARRSR